MSEKPDQAFWVTHDRGMVKVEDLSRAEMISAIYHLCKERDAERDAVRETLSLLKGLPQTFGKQG